MDATPRPKLTDSEEVERLEHQLERNETREKRDVRGLLAIISLISSFALAFTQLFITCLITAADRECSAEIPAWAAAVVTGIAGFYFGSRGGSSNDNGS